jgi:putative tricarboxylic transport membrane protein
MGELGTAVSMLFTSWVVPAALGGLIWGILGGATPGLSASITMALLLPFTYAMPPMPAIVMLATCYIGAEYGGSIPAILIRTPGTNASAATIMDGYEMNRQGRAGEALGLSLWSGVVGGLFGLAMLILLTEPLSRLALLFKPTTYFGLGILGLSVIASLSSKSLIKGLAAALLGLMIATIGTDPISGVSRFTFGAPDLLDGIAPLFVMVGLYALTELMTRTGIASNIIKPNTSIRVRLPRLPMMKRVARSQAIGCTIGTVEGLMPGAGGTCRGVHRLQRVQTLVETSGRIRPRLAGRRCRPRSCQQHGRQRVPHSASFLRNSGIELGRGSSRRIVDPWAAAGATPVRAEFRCRARYLHRVVRGRYCASGGG